MSSTSGTASTPAKDATRIPSFDRNGCQLHPRPCKAHSDRYMLCHLRFDEDRDIVLFWVVLGPFEIPFLDPRRRTRFRLLRLTFGHLDLRRCVLRRDTTIVPIHPGLQD